MAAFTGIAMFAFTSDIAARSGSSSPASCESSSRVSCLYSDDCLPMCCSFRYSQSIGGSGMAGTGSGRMALMASRSGSGSPSACWSSSSLSSSGRSSAALRLVMSLPFVLRVLRDAAATRHVSCRGPFSHVGRDRRIDVSNELDALGRPPEMALDHFSDLHFLIFAVYRPAQTTVLALIWQLFRLLCKRYVRACIAQRRGEETSGSLPNL